MTKETQQPDDDYIVLEIPLRDADKFGVDVRPASEFDAPEQAQSGGELKGDHHG